jgi:hypothetical protein
MKWTEDGEGEGEGDEEGEREGEGDRQDFDIDTRCQNCRLDCDRQIKMSKQKMMFSCRF